MAENVKVLGQVDMPASALTAIYLAGAVNGAVVSTFYVANRTGGTLHFRVSVAVGAAVDNVKQYIYYDVAIPPNETFASTTGISMALGDELRGYADGVGLSFTAFGLERT